MNLRLRLVPDAAVNTLVLGGTATWAILEWKPTPKSKWQAVEIDGVVPTKSAASALDDAIVAVSKATDGSGLAVVLCRDPRDMQAVRESIKQVAGWFTTSGAFVSKAAQRASAKNLGLLCELLVAHLDASP